MERNTKIEKFLEEYKKLVDKHKVDFANYPVWIPDDNGGFRMIIQTTPVDMEQLKKGNFLK